MVHIYILCKSILFVFLVLVTIIYIHRFPCEPFSYMAIPQKFSHILQQNIIGREGGGGGGPLKKRFFVSKSISMALVEMISKIP